MAVGCRLQMWCSRAEVWGGLSAPHLRHISTTTRVCDSATASQLCQTRCRVDEGRGLGEQRSEQGLEGNQPTKQDNTKFNETKAGCTSPTSWSSSESTPAATALPPPPPPAASRPCALPATKERSRKGPVPAPHTMTDTVAMAFPYS
eukprot:107350-Chlamydomonas_euryale.AAC.12